MVYEIEFMSGTVEYEYDIDAANGEVVKFSREDKAPVSTPVSTPVPTPVPTPTATAQPDAASAPSSQPASQPCFSTHCTIYNQHWNYAHCRASQVYCIESCWPDRRICMDLSIDLDQRMAILFLT